MAFPAARHISGRRIEISSLLCVAWLAMSGDAMAQQKLPEDACHDGANTGAINACLSKVYADLDVELNARYKAAFKFIDRAGLEPTLRRDWKRAFQEAQRKWISFREADCGPIIVYETNQGSIGGAMQLGCKIARTRDRLETLKRRYSNS